MEIEDDIKLTHVAIVFIHLLDISVDDLEGDELIINSITAGDEEEGGIATVDDLGVWQKLLV